MRMKVSNYISQKLVDFGYHTGIYRDRRRSDALK